jgi:hypothetical protein
MTSAPIDVVVFRPHFSAFAKSAASNALRAALQTETTPDAVAEFFEWRLDDELCRFSESFIDFWGFDRSFRQAAKRTVSTRARTYERA